MFDISKVNLSQNAKEGVWHDVKLPNGEPAGFRWKLRGVDSEPVMAAYVAQGEVAETDVAGLSRLAVNVIMAATVAIEDLTSGGVPVTPENCKPILEEHKSWLTPQLMEVVADRMRFFGSG